MKAFAIFRGRARWLALAIAAAGSLPQALHAAGDTVPFDRLAIAEPVLGRAVVAPENLGSVTVHTPFGAKAYIIGDTRDTRPKVVAWYHADSGRLLAAIELIASESARQHREGVRVSAGTTRGGATPAILEVSTKANNPALLKPGGAVSIQAAGEKDTQAVAPLLSFKGSSHLLALASPVHNRVLHARDYTVRVRDASGKRTEFEQHLPASGGNLPVQIQVTPAKPNAPAKVTVVNPSATSKRVLLKPLEPVYWYDSRDNRVRTVHAPAQGKADPGQVASPVPGSYNLAYSEQRVPQVGREPLTPGPIPLHPGGASILPVQPGFFQPDSVAFSQPHAQGPVQSSGTVTGGGSSNDLQEIALVGLAAGVATIMLSDRTGNRHEEQVTVVPTALPDLEEQSAQVLVTAVSEPGMTLADLAGTTLAMAPQEGCACYATIVAKKGGVQVKIERDGAGRPYRVVKDGDTYVFSADAKLSGCKKPSISYQWTWNGAAPAGGGAGKDLTFTYNRPAAGNAAGGTLRVRVTVTSASGNAVCDAELRLEEEEVSGGDCKGFLGRVTVKVSSGQAAMRNEEGKAVFDHQDITFSWEKTKAHCEGPEDKCQAALSFNWTIAPNCEVVGGALNSESVTCRARTPATTWTATLAVTLTCGPKGGPASCSITRQGSASVTTSAEGLPQADRKLDGK